LWALPEATISGPLPQNALCGLNLALSLPTRRRLPAKWFYGAADAPGFRDALAQTVHALRGRRALVGGRVLWIGGAAPGFDRLESVPDLPLEIHRAGLETLFAAIEAVDPADAAARLGASDEPADGQAGALLATMRLELALERLASGFDGVALRCWPELPDRAGTMACAALARLADRGLPMACEGDAAGLAAMLAASAVTGGPAVLLDLSRAERDALLFWHCGNAPRALAAGATRLAAHFNRGLPAVREMRLAPGPVCGLRFLEDHAAVVYGGRLVDRADGYDGVCGWIGGLRWAGRPVDPAGFLASVLNLRLPHHFVWAAGDHERALLELCQWIDLRVLDPDPTPRLVRWPA
jgi:L-fucose isomerase-like protein